MRWHFINSELKFVLLWMALLTNQKALLTHWPVEDVVTIFKMCSRQTQVTDYVHGHFLNCSQVNATAHLWWLVSIGLGNGLVLSAWCRHATSHYLSQCWSRSMSYGVTRSKCVNGLTFSDTILIGWQLYCQPIRCHVRSSALANRYLKRIIMSVTAKSGSSEIIRYSTS